MSELDIFEIERFAIHDGPGIRTTVFFQGCPLRCEWCANPESQTIGRHILSFSKLCSGCGKCADVCAQNAVSIADGKSLIDRSRCVSCGSCAAECPNNAIKVSGRKISCTELFDTVKRDIDYYRESGGGVTLSGGEALLHINRLVPFLEECRKNRIHIAAETCGYVPASNMELALEYVNLFLFDIKTLDGRKFRQFTGGSIDVVLSCFELLCKSAPEKVVVRVPVIPDFNSEEVSEIMKYAAKHGIKIVHLLPYHTLGMAKYEQLGRKYPYHVRESLDPASLDCHIDTGSSLGLTVKIGG